MEQTAFCEMLYLATKLSDITSPKSSTVSRSASDLLCEGTFHFHPGCDL